MTNKVNNKILISFIVTLLIMISSIPAYAEDSSIGDVSDDISLQTIEEEFDSYILENTDIELYSTGYYKYIVDQLIDETDTYLTKMDNYSLFREYMAQYKIAYEEYLLLDDEENIVIDSEEKADIVDSNSCINMDESGETVFELSTDFLSRTIGDIVDENQRAGYCDNIFSIDAAKSNYSATKAANYAITYAKAYNRADYPVYFYDCTNFVSQCLFAGGIPKVGSNSKTGMYNSTKKWYCVCTKESDVGHGREYAVTTSWVNVADFNTYMSSVAKAKSTKKTVEGLYKSCRKGDVVQIVTESGTPYHTVIISKRDSDTAYYSGHSNDRKNAPISNLFSKKNEKVILFDFT